MVKHDEMASLVNGMSFVLHYANKPAYTVMLDEAGALKKDYTSESRGTKPVILVSIGSGVSIIKVKPFESFERVSGTMIGGGTLVGLSNLLTGIKDFDKIIEMASKGNNSNVDMMVKDIYGQHSPFKELQGDLLASSFAKIAND